MQRREQPYKLTLDLRVLDHLGINLYSNAAAVLSEAVANSWDADAKVVKVDIQKERITIADDGVGMTLDAVNNRFLNVGYDKRAAEGESSKRGRAFMGRKGIGKLALFSIADQIEVHTTTGREMHAFRMVADDIRAAIGAHKLYYPVPIKFKGPSKGTMIVLTSLKKRRTAHSVAALRKRIARRFSIIGYKDAKGISFNVNVNGVAVGPRDREDLKAIEFLWEFGGKQVVPASNCPDLRGRNLLNAVVRASQGWTVRGWLGAASEPKKLKHDEAGAMNGIVVFARGRLIQENILDKLNFSRILGSYITGQVEADFLDVKGAPDVATSDRQRLIEDDERYEALRDFLRNTLVSIGDKWTKWRNETRGDDAVSEQSGLSDWLETLPEPQRPAARRMLGVIRGADFEDEEERLILYRSGIAAFERLRLNDLAQELGEDEALTAKTLLPLLADVATYEGALYRDIVRSRLQVLSKFEGLVDANEKEKVLQQHLFKNLWLLDAGWERAAESVRMEETLKKRYPKEFGENLTEKESKGRADIRYMTNAGEHIIVELKRARRTMTVPELMDQGGKYFSALRTLLQATGEANPNVSIVFVVGQRVREEDNPQLGAKHVTESLRPINGRVMHYEALIQHAHAAYRDFLNQSVKANRLEKLIAKLVTKQD